MSKADDPDLEAEFKELMNDDSIIKNIAEMHLAHEKFTNEIIK
jgi:hypothetical protein